MQVGDLVDFEFEDAYTGLVLSKSEEPVPHVQVLFFDKAVINYTMEELDACSWEVISASR
jgi:hypothetical protein